MKKRFFAALSSIFILGLLTSCADLFQPKVDMDGETTSSLVDLLSIEKESTSLSAPAQIFASQGNSTTSISVTWSSVPGAVSYCLERAVVLPSENGSYTPPSEDEFSPILLNGYNTEQIFATSFEDVILSEATSTAAEYDYRYYYRVCAENIVKGYTSSEFIETSSGAYLFAPPKNANAGAGDSATSITVTWNRATKATRYNIYRTQNSNGSASEKIGSVTANESKYEDKNFVESDRGKEFYYSITAVNSSGKESAKSNIAMGYTLVEGAPGKVSNVRVTSGRGASTDEIQIAWDAAAGGTGTVYYDVYRTSSLDSTLVKIKANETKTTFNDKTKSLKTGVYYYYYVQPWCYEKANDANSPKLKAAISDSGPASSSPAEGFLLSPPATLFAVKSSGSIILNFTPALGSSAEQRNYSYEIYGESSQDGLFQTPIVTVESGAELNENGYYVKKVSAGTTFLKVKTVNGSVSSNHSVLVSPSPLSAKDVNVSRYKNLGNNYTANNSGVYPVQISWAPPEDNGDVAGYYVYRGQTANGSFKRINENMIPAGTETFVDDNSTAKVGVIYYYKVLTVNELNQGSNYSESNWGYGAITADQYMREYNKTVIRSQQKLTLMHKGGTSAVGSESARGDIKGTLGYNAKIAGLGAEITMPYTDYADFYIHEGGIVNSSAPESRETVIGTDGGCYFTLNGNSNTTANMSANGTMNGTVNCKGMYPGSVGYDYIEIKGGGAGGGYYVITREGFTPENVSYTVGNER